MVLFWFFFFNESAWPPATPTGHRLSTGALTEAMRANDNLSLQQLADRMTSGGYRTTKAALYRYERGERPIPLEAFDAVVAACGFDLAHVHNLRAAGLGRLRDERGRAHPAEHDEAARPDGQRRAQLVEHFRQELRSPVDWSSPPSPPLEAPQPAVALPPQASPESTIELKEQEIIAGLRSSPTTEAAAKPQHRAIRLAPPLRSKDTVERLAHEATSRRQVTLIASSRQGQEQWQAQLGPKTTQVRVQTSWDFIRHPSETRSEPTTQEHEEAKQGRLLIFDGIDAVRPMERAIADGRFQDTDIVVVASALDGLTERTLASGQIEVEEVGHLRDSFRGGFLAGFTANLLITDAPPPGSLWPRAAVEHLKLWSSPGRLVILAGADKPAEWVAETLRWRSRSVAVIGGRMRPGPTERAFHHFKSDPNGVLCLGRRVRRLDPLPSVARVCLFSPIRSGRLEEHVLPFLAASAGDSPVRFDELVLGDARRRIRAWERLIERGTSEVGPPGTLRFSPFPPR
jgi:transcriptional regulator with XRE-family HTH domain